MPYRPGEHLELDWHKTGLKRYVFFCREKLLRYLEERCKISVVVAGGKAAVC